MNSDDLHFHSLKAISPIDGRHRIITEPLSEWFSEFAFFKYRIFVEIQYLLALSEDKNFNALRQFTKQEKENLNNIFINFNLEDAKTIQNIDQFGYGDLGPVHHDMKAVEYFLKLKLKDTSLHEISEFIHFGLTSEDVNNLAINCMVQGLLEQHYLLGLTTLLDKIADLAEKNANVPLLARTHGQPATPTTLGKELANFLERLRNEYASLKKLVLKGKLNGAVGNFNAHVFSSPEVDWVEFSKNFITKLGFKPNLLTTQIESHDSLCKLFSILVSINNILKDLTVDLWLYTSKDYLKQKNIAGEIGSSTMPHKINPWRLEIAEGSTQESNAKLLGFINKLQSSRLQRDLSDHEALRAIGVGIAHSYIALLHLSEDLERLTPNADVMKNDLMNRGDILTEAIQTLLRKENYSQPYELLKEFSRGKQFSLVDLHNFLDKLELKDETKQKLKSLTPENYLGAAIKLTQLALKNWEQTKTNNVKAIPQMDSVSPQVVAVLGGQWGDEGKGKVIDYIAENFEVVARATGGNNAGHTIYINGEKHIFHLIPSAITWEKSNCILGNGMVIDPFVLFMEVDKLFEKGFNINNLFISGDAHVILLYHKMQDHFQEISKGDSKKIGTTKRGIGPAYADKSHRVGVRINDLFDKKILKEKIKLNLIEKFKLFKHVYNQSQEEIFSQLIESVPNVERYISVKEKLNSLKGQSIDTFSDVLTEIYFEFGENLQKHIISSTVMIKKALDEGKNILLEGAQGLLLDIDHGTYPFVTSSNPSVGGLETGLGIAKVDKVYSLIKAYVTRVGSGPFPTELTDATGELLRKQGHEFGSTTGRPRRCGWQDVVIARHASAINGSYVVITKLDVLGGLKKLKICNSYKYVGEKKYFNGEIYSEGKIIKDFPANSDILQNCVPHDFVEVDGWEEDISNIKNYHDLPLNAKHYLKEIEELGNLKISKISVGPLREQIIEVPGECVCSLESSESSIKIREQYSAAQEKITTECSEKKYKAVIYDLDNTLVATNQFVKELILKTATELTISLPIKIPSEQAIKVVQSKNLPFEVIFEKLFPNPNDYVGKPLWEIVLEKYREKAPQIPYYPTKGALDTFNKLNKQGVVQIIVTNRIKMAELRLLQAGFKPGVDGFFIVAPESKEKRKPNPECFNSAFEFLKSKGIEKQEVISVGDHTDDYIASEKAGLTFVGVLTGEITQHDFEDLGLQKSNILNNLLELSLFFKL